jgi:hypothetical protein
LKGTFKLDNITTWTGIEKKEHRRSFLPILNIFVTQEDVPKASDFYFDEKSMYKYGSVPEEETKLCLWIVEYEKLFELKK